jgi:hypothetical protein
MPEGLQGSSYLFPTILAKHKVSRRLYELTETRMLLPSLCPEEDAEKGKPL